ncbi:MAG: transcriptional regulator, Rrf2, partial [Planctomycetaceae bacterium]|nr:transcriptional regulator, Rrf2 [Planctomycetaceae bacterium]
MKLSLQTDFALRVLIYAAFRDERINISDVANFFDISKAHVAKV